MEDLQCMRKELGVEDLKGLVAENTNVFSF